MRDPELPEGAPSDGNASPKLIYILGWGRSGSTLLDNILGMNPGFFSMGELHYLWSRGVLEERRCGCGMPVGECPVWGQILERLHEDLPWTKDAAAVVRLQEKTVRNRLVPRLVWLTRKNGRLDEDVAAYRSVLISLLRAVVEVTGARVVIDSTKRVPDALVTSSLSGVDPYFIHLVRDPRASAFSWARAREMPDTREESIMRRFSSASSTLRWLLWGGTTEILGRRWGRSRFLTVRYEDFIAQPRTTVDRVLSFLGESAIKPPFSDERTVALGTNHTVSGNPSRFRRGKVELRLDDEWLTSQSMRDRFLATTIALPLLGHFGYPLRRRARHP